MLQFGPKKPSEQAGNVHSYKICFKLNSTKDLLDLSYAYHYHLCVHFPSLMLKSAEHTVLGLNISNKKFYISFAEFKE